ncbi:MAG: hypothetical protein ICV54_05455 [Nostoc sp. C3-bin3]|nr:hypothetical protein [Nostoc sp. C3-bin3]
MTLVFPNYQVGKRDRYFFTWSLLMLEVLAYQEKIVRVCVGVARRRHRLQKLQ